MYLDIVSNEEPFKVQSRRIVSAYYENQLEERNTGPGMILV